MKTVIANLSVRIFFFVKFFRPFLKIFPHQFDHCALDEESIEKTFLGRNATVIGWGRLTEFGESSRILQKVNVGIISNEVCKYMYDPIEVTDNMLCAGDSKGGKDACQGDSGGSLSIKVKKYIVS